MHSPLANEQPPHVGTVGCQLGQEKPSSWPPSVRRLSLLCPRPCVHFCPHYGLYLSAPITSLCLDSLKTTVHSPPPTAIRGLRAPLVHREEPGGRLLVLSATRTSLRSPHSHLLFAFSPMAEKIIPLLMNIPGCCFLLLLLKCPYIHSSTLFPGHVLEVVRGRNYSLLFM